MTTQTNPPTKQPTDTKQATSPTPEQNSESETDLLIPYVSDNEDDVTEASSFGHCWHCDAPLPLPTSNESSVDCLECQFPN
jgi:hypothetical protein